MLVHGSPRQLGILGKRRRKMVKTSPPTTSATASVVPLSELPLKCETQLETFCRSLVKPPSTRCKRLRSSEYQSELDRIFSCFDELVRERIFSFLTRIEALRYGLQRALRSCMFRRLLQPFPSTMVVERLDGGESVLQLEDKLKYADAYFADCIRQVIVHRAPLRCFDWIFDYSEAFFSNQRDVKLTHRYEMWGACLEAVRWALVHKKLSLFKRMIGQGLRFDPTWLHAALADNLFPFVDCLLTQFRVRKAKLSTFVCSVKSLEMMKSLQSYHFPFDSRLMCMFLIKKDWNAVLWLLEQGVKEMCNNTQSDFPSFNFPKEPWLVTAVRAGWAEIIPHLAHARCRFDSDILQFAIVQQQQRECVEMMYQCFSGLGQSVFLDSAKHLAFLNKFLGSWICRHDEPYWRDMFYYLSNYTKDMNAMLLFLVAVQKQSVHHLEFLIAQGLHQGLHANVFDEALRWPCPLVCNWLLDHDVCCSQMAMESYICTARRDKSKWQRIKTILSHPSAQQLWMPPIWHKIHTEVPDSIRPLLLNASSNVPLLTYVS